MSTSFITNIANDGKISYDSTKKPNSRKETKNA